MSTPIQDNWLETLLKYGRGAGLDGKTIYLCILAILATILKVGSDVGFWQAMAFVVVLYSLPPLHRVISERRKRPRVRDILRIEVGQTHDMLEVERLRRSRAEPELPLEQNDPRRVEAGQEGHDDGHDRD